MMRLGLIAAGLALVAAMPLLAGEFWVTLLSQIMIFGLLALSADLLLGNAGLFSLCHAAFFAVAAYTTGLLHVRYGATTALASFLAGMAGVVGGAFLTLNPGAEWDILVLALVVVIIGGLGSLEGAILGSIIVGLLDAYGRWLLPEFSYFVLFGPMAILLLFRATGIFGKEH